MRQIDNTVLVLIVSLFICFVCLVLSVCYTVLCEVRLTIYLVPGPDLRTSLTSYTIILLTTMLFGAVVHIGWIVTFFLYREKTTGRNFYLLNY